LKVFSGSPGGFRKPPHYLTAPCLQSWHFVKRESPSDSSIYLITNPPGLILGPVHLGSIAELSPSSVAGRIHLYGGLGGSDASVKLQDSSYVTMRLLFHLAGLPLPGAAGGGIIMEPQRPKLGCAGCRILMRASEWVVRVNGRAL
jgi:hypothetical protein